MEQYPRTGTYPQEPPTESESNKSGEPTGNIYSRRSINEAPDGPNVGGEKETPLESPPEDSDLMNNIVRGGLSGIPEENITSIRH